MNNCSPGKTRCLCRQNSDFSYEINVDSQDLLNDVLPIVMPKLLDVLKDATVNSEIIKEAMARKILSPSQLDRVYPSPSAGQSRLYEQSQFSQQRENIQYKSKSQPLISQGQLRRDSLLEDYGFSENTNRLPKSHSYFRITDYRYKRQQKTQKQKFIRKTYIAVLVAGLLFGTAVAILGAVIVWFTKDNKDNVLSTAFHSSCISVIAAGRHMVRSLDEYNVLARGNSLLVGIKIAEASDWPSNVYIENSKNITDLYITGPMHANKIIELLAGNITLKKLVLSNACDKMCLETQQEITTLRNQKALLPVKEIVLENFQDSCSKLLGIFNYKLVAKDLEEFSFDKGVINTDNINHIEHILEKSSSTLQRIEVTNSTVSTEMFSTKWPVVFSGVKTIVFDDENTGAGLSPDFCYKFPNLQHFSYGSKLRSWVDFLKILPCRKLKSVNFWLEMPTQQTNFSLAVLSEHFPVLESAEITLIFPKCSQVTKGAGNGNYILGRNTLSNVLLYNVGIVSNCFILLVSEGKKIR